MTDLRKAAQQALDAIEALEGLSNQEERVLGRICDKIRTALAQPDVPEGYVPVPVEPTEDQIKAGDKWSWPYPSAQIYRAMLAAAQKGGA